MLIVLDETFKGFYSSEPNMYDPIMSSIWLYPCLVVNIV